MRMTNRWNLVVYRLWAYFPQVDGRICA